MRRSNVIATKLCIRHNHPSHATLSGLPEFATAIDDINNGRFSAALPKLQRTHEIMSAAYSAQAPEVILAKLRLAQTYFCSGDFKSAQQLYVPACQNTEIASYATLRAVYCALAMKSFDQAMDLLATAPCTTSIDAMRVATYVLAGKSEEALKVATESHARSTQKMLSANNLAAMTCYHHNYKQATLLPYFLCPPDSVPSREQLAPALNLFADAIETSTPELTTEERALTASVHCNIGETLQSLGDAKHAAEHFSRAVKLLENQSSLEGYLGRALYHIATRYMETGEAVTAEGLLKSCFEKFSAPHAKHDLRHQYHHARALITYGTLLSRWEKRENDGATYMAKGMDKLKTLPHTNGIYLNHFIYLPV